MSLPVQFNQPKRTRLSQESPFYVSPKALKEEILKYQMSHTDEKQRRMSNALGSMLIKIAKRYSSRSNFARYTYRDEMISDAIYKMVISLDKINLQHPKCNPFSYLTCCCYCSFILCIKKNQSIQAKLKDLRELVYADFLSTEGLVDKKEAIEVMKNISDTMPELQALFDPQEK